ncbi:MAG: hypothetical protein ACFFKA_03665, partial [Candidatus Thorarchaeota archaeon]
VFYLGYFLGNGSWIVFNFNNNKGDNPPNDDTDDGGKSFNLILPKTSTMFLENEAGLACYTNVSYTLNLANAKSQFRTIEADDPNYVVGSLELPGLPETEDVHCFVHKDGWIVTYYLKAEPVSKIIDWSYYSAGTLSETKLSLGLDKMCLALSIFLTYINYYDFEFPNANKLKLIIEETTGQSTDSFDIKLTSTFNYYERSWSHYVSSGGYSYLRLNGYQISYVYSGTFNYGELTPAQLTLDVFHNVEVYISNTNTIGYGAIALVYYEP